MDDEECVSNSYAGPLTNLLVIPKTSLIPPKTHQSVSNGYRVSLLEKNPKGAKGTVTIVPASCSFEDQKTSLAYRSIDLMTRQILELEVLSLSLYVIY